MIWAWFFLFLGIWLYLKLWDELPVVMLYVTSFARLAFWITVLAGVLSYFGRDGLWNVEIGLFS